MSDPNSDPNAAEGTAQSGLEGDENKLTAQRREKLAAIRERDAVAFPNDFRRDALAADLHRDHGEADAAALEAQPVAVNLAGRLMTKRIMGKASFAHLQDMSGRMQVFLQRDSLPEGQYEAFKSWDLGDIIGVEGQLFRTKTGELSVRVASARLLTKSLRPLPEKFHGLTDAETCYRQRYLDLIMNEDSRRVFRLRSAIVHYIREFLTDRGFLEVETPMMQVIPGGARARPFITHHNALDMDLYLRIAPELFREGIRDQPQFPQRGTVDQAQSRIHHDRVLSGLRGLPRPDGPDRGVAARHGAKAAGRHRGHLPGHRLRPGSAVPAHDRAGIHPALQPGHHGGRPGRA